MAKEARTNLQTPTHRKKYLGRDHIATSTVSTLLPGHLTTVVTARGNIHTTICRRLSTRHSLATPSMFAVVRTIQVHGATRCLTARCSRPTKSSSTRMAMLTIGSPSRPSQASSRFLTSRTSLRVPTSHLPMEVYNSKATTGTSTVCISRRLATTASRWKAHTTRLNVAHSVTATIQVCSLASVINSPTHPWYQRERR